MNPLITVVVPVYNVENYLANCISSVLKQSYLDYELILIDDGSKDSSGKICDYYAGIDRRVIVKHIKNNGVSNARNTGIKMASGEWLLFLDGDDKLQPNTLECISKNIIEHSQLDMVIGSFNYVINSNIVEEPNYDCYKKGSDLLHDYGLWKIKICMGSFAVRRRILDKYNIAFNTHTKYGEDVEFVNYCLIHSLKVKITKEYFLNYIVHNSSAIAKVSLDRYDCYQSRLRTLKYIRRFVPDNKEIELLYVYYLLPEAIIDTTYLLCRNGFNILKLLKFLRDKEYYNVIFSVQDNVFAPKEIRMKIKKFIKNPYLTWLKCYQLDRYYNLRQYLGGWKRRVLGEDNSVYTDV